QPRYNPWLSRWSFGYSYGSGFLRAGFRWSSAAKATTPARVAMWYGPGGYHRPLVGSDMALMRTWRPTRGHDRLPANLYPRARTPVRAARLAGRRAVFRIAGPGPRPARRPNDVSAGRDGKVYRRDVGGNWQVNVGPTWRPTEVRHAPPPPPQTSGGESSASWR